MQIHEISSVAYWTKPNTRALQQLEFSRGSGREKGEIREKKKRKEKKSGNVLEVVGKKGKEGKKEKRKGNVLERKKW